MHLEDVDAMDSDINFWICPFLSGARVKTNPNQQTDTVKC